MAAARDPAHPSRQISGYRKIQQTCEIACAQGIEYAWVDTCCIDKSSSAELSEAINSMFQWYQAAEICYAYLSDLPPDSRSSLDTRVPECKWFTRGWCLQELIAPQEVIFLDSCWEPVGRKTDREIMQLVSRTTNIDEAVLSDSGILSSLPLAQKMSWAAKRETTRTEDMAYCLLGIFDINMPMLYGEGKKAFQRLQEEIMKRSNDLSIFAWDVSRLPEVREGAPDFIDLFAESPLDFSKCVGLMHEPTALAGNHTFSITNNGLLLSGATFFSRFRTRMLLTPSWLLFRE